jgi:parallel beta-helix repeat protein
VNARLVKATLALGGVLAFLGCREPTAPPIDPAQSPSLQLTAAPTTPVTECFTSITEPGDYTLMNDLVDCHPGNIFIVSGRLGGRVTLRLNGHRIAWTGDPDAIVGSTGISVGSYVTVLGPGVVEGYWANIGIGGERSEVRGVTARYPQSWNVLVAGARHLMIEGNAFKGGPEAGMLITGGSRGVVVVRNEFQGEFNIYEILQLKDVTGIEIRNNVFRNAWKAVTIDGGSSNIVVGNRVFDFREVGISLENTVSNQILGNTMRRNEVGVRVWGGGNHLVVGNTITDGGLGISMESGQTGPTSGNRIERNTVLDNSTDLGDELGCATQNLWLNNIFNTATSDCLH